MSRPVSGFLSKDGLFFTTERDAEMHDHEQVLATELCGLVDRTFHGYGVNHAVVNVLAGWVTKNVRDPRLKEKS